MNLMFVVLGVGVKVVVVVVKVFVLCDMGVDVFDVIVVECIGVGVNWQVSGGWIDGVYWLGISLEKDVGFFYWLVLVLWCNVELDEWMICYSWQLYLIVIVLFVEWIDWGCLVFIYCRWSQYLVWVVDYIGFKVIYGEVEWFVVIGDCWVLCIYEIIVQVDVLMIIGFGQVEKLLLFGNLCVFLIVQFWDCVVGYDWINVEWVVVIGGGEMVVLMFNELFWYWVLIIIVIFLQVILFICGEGFFENLLFFDLIDWVVLMFDEWCDVLVCID